MIDITTSGPVEPASTYCDMNTSSAPCSDNFVKSSSLKHRRAKYAMCELDVYTVASPMYMGLIFYYQYPE